MDSMLLEEIIGVLAEHLGLSIDDITIDSVITDDLRADSLDIVELVDIFEKKYDITATDEEIMELSTVESVYDFIAERIGVTQKNDRYNDNQISFIN